ncbi:Inhibitor of growth protein 3 [Fukomys damarensis]|uniref:Inhibitor of growth protein 3 n=1 Tax=Fukomys damarensis TaxID=885580 RepID=A0A091D9M6_FUKDA|nr:Inhibitor of growth protein 3 [Fukomys damarensis]
MDERGGVILDLLREKSTKNTGNGAGAITMAAAQAVQATAQMEERASRLKASSKAFKNNDFQLGKEFSMPREGAGCLSSSALMTTLTQNASSSASNSQSGQKSKNNKPAVIIILFFFVIVLKFFISNCCAGNLPADKGASRPGTEDLHPCSVRDADTLYLILTAETSKSQLDPAKPETRLHLPGRMPSPIA